MSGKDVDELKIWMKNVEGKLEEGEIEDGLYITHPFLFTCGLGVVKGKERKGLSNLFREGGGKLGGFLKRIEEFGGDVHEALEEEGGSGMCAQY